MSKMRPEFPLLSSRKQQGFGLVAAIFLIVVIAGIIGAMWRLSVTQTATNNLSLQQARAYQAARAGLEWGIYRFMNGASCTTATPFTISQLDGFHVRVECAPQPEQRREHNDLSEEGPDGRVIQSVIATAEYSTLGSPDYAYRRLVAVVER